MDMTGALGTDGDSGGGGNVSVREPGLLGPIFILSGQRLLLTLKMAVSVIGIPSQHPLIIS